MEAILFDLDGTLVDTAPDLIGALNAALTAGGYPPVSPEFIAPQISNGALAMVETALGYEPGDPAALPERDRMLEYYTRHIADHSRLFPGMEDVLNLLENHGIPWGIVTNKATRFTEPLLEKLDLLGRSGVTVSGDTLARKKPYPDTILHACKVLGCKPENSLYIGDAGRDIEAGQRAGTATGVALFGYLQETDEPHNWNADWLFESPQDLHQRLEHLLAALTLS